MKTFTEFVAENKQTFIIHGQSGGKFVTHEIEAKSHDHAKKLFKKAMREKGDKYAYASTIRTRDEEAAHIAKADKLSKEREALIAKNQAERDKDKEYWDSRQKEYDKQTYKGE